MKDALGIGGFPVELILNSHPLLPVPAVQFEKNPAGISELFNKKINIFVSPTEYFVTKFRDIFSKTQIKHTTGKESRSWLSGPKMKYWPQQLNFALWCATTGSGISWEILTKLSQQLRGFFLFHVYFTVRRILFEMGGFRVSALFPEIQRLTKRKTNSTHRLSKGSALNSELIQTRTFVSFTDKITAWVIVMFQGIHNLTRIGHIHQRVLIIQVPRGFLMKEDQQQKLEIGFSEMNWITLLMRKVLITNLIGLCPTKLKDSLRRGSHALTNRSRPLFTAFLGHR